MACCTLVAAVLCLVLIPSQARSEDRGDGDCKYPRGPAYAHMPRPRCPDASWPTFDLYTRSANSRAARVTKKTIPSTFNVTGRTIFLVHGFLSDGHVPWILKMKDELLKKGHYNIIIVDWKNGAKSGKMHEMPKDYEEAASTTRVVGRLLADLARHLVTSGGADRKQMWCVGHGLGAHTCGEVGAVFRFDRVTGLDPAGPLFSNHSNIGIRVDSADFVDVIHTDQPKPVCCGYIRPRGHADFYPNGGRRQPGCLNKTAESNWFGCSHMKATAYFTDSISRCRFYSTKECNPDLIIHEELCAEFGHPIQEMGFNAYRRQGMYYVITEGACGSAQTSDSRAASGQMSALLFAMLSVKTLTF